MKPAGVNVAVRAIELCKGPRIEYGDVDCQAFIEQCVNDCGGALDTSGTNDMVRNHCAWLGTIENARAEGRLVPGAGLLIHEDDESGLPAKYQGDGLGDFSHVALYVGDGALYDEDKNGKARLCDAVHSSQTMGRVAGTTVKNGYTHVMWFTEIDYGVDVAPGVTPGGGGDAVSDGADNVSDGAGSQSAAHSYATVFAADGGAVKLRPQPERGSLWWEVASGTRVSVERTKNGWALIRAVCTDGASRRAWMMGDYLIYEG